jgi:hypothetical protein
MFNLYELIDLEELNSSLYELAVEEINELFSTASYYFETQIIF